MATPTPRDEQPGFIPLADIPYCPSAQPDMQGSMIFGVVGGSADEPRVAYLDKPIPVTDEVLALAEPVLPTEVFRFAAPCAGSGCQHFDGHECRLAARTVEILPEAVDVLPPCAIRSKCRWWKQEGKAACLRCPFVVTHNEAPTDMIALAANPTTPVARAENTAPAGNAPASYPPAP